MSEPGTPEPVDALRLCRLHPHGTCDCADETRETYRREAALERVLLKRVLFENDVLDVEVQPPPVIIRALYAGLVQTVGDAPNYVETRVRFEGKEFIVTVRRREGKTPHELQKAAEANAAKWKMRALDAGVVE